jgi:hypothetical protein
VNLRDYRRFLCSELVTLRLRDGDLTVNLEEIWKNGAVVEGEGDEMAPVEGEPAEIRSRLTDEPSVFFAGKIREIETNEFGWRARIELSPLTPWSVEEYRPLHLTDVTPEN